MTTYEAAVRLLAAETPEEEERASRAYLATWTPLGKPAKRARRKAAKPRLPDNVVSLAKWKVKLADAQQTGSK
jgi:hypothetical protein